MTDSTSFPPEHTSDPHYPESAVPQSFSSPQHAVNPKAADVGGHSTAGVAAHQAGEVAGGAADAGKHVAGVAQEQAQQVAGEAKNQAKELLHQSKGELTEQASAQQKRLASGLRALGDELGTIAQSSDNPGVASDLVHQVADRAGSVASWLDDREPGHVLDEVTRFARRRPGAFLAIAAGAGLLAGRLGRGLLADDTGTSPQAERRDQVPHTPSPPAPQRPSDARPIVPAAEPVGQFPPDAGSEFVSPTERPIQNTGYTAQPGYRAPNTGLQP
ncbi:hypothetical protein [Rhodococcus sp. Eu-32]|uniref:hypothetical protein n=1 Tax=Rhodococcus sp. Eu-32 TaxID=1017319 RepID=UPI001A9E6002|nr:hypothetical protein [Rhodococcus sp. Eu-32]